MIHLKHIHIEFDRILFEDEMMDISYGQITGFIGESGSGKTSLLQEIGMLTQQCCMNYDFDGFCIDKESEYFKSQFRRSEIAFITQNIDLFDELTMRENFDLIASFIDRTLTEKEIYHYMNYVNLSLDINTPVSLLSGGERQRVAIICGLIKQARLFIFDEPTAYLDYTNKQSVIQIMKKLAHEENKMVIVASHDEEIWDCYDVIYRIDHQHILKEKECDYEDKPIDREISSFHFSALTKYIHLLFKKRKSFYIFISVLLACSIGMIVFFSTYMNNYQIKMGQSLLDLLGYEVKVMHSDEILTPMNQTKIKNQLSDYSVYPFYTYLGNITYDNQVITDVSIIPYLTNEKSLFKIYTNTDSNSSFDDFKTNEDIYVSYSLHQIINDKNYSFVGMKNENIHFDYSYVLKPSNESSKAIYVPYSVVDEYLEEVNIDKDMLNVTVMRIPITNIEDIFEIKDLLNEPFSLYFEPGIEESLSIMNIYQSTFLIQFIGLLIIIILIYKIFEVWKNKKKIALFKMHGMSIRNLILMKVYEESVLLIWIFLLSISGLSVVLFVINLLSFETFVNCMFWILIYLIVIECVVLTFYSFLVMKISASALLKTND
ncbi:MAG: ATP-binding cassette domain-containing protein [Coprobacillus sp.]